MRRIQKAHTLLALSCTLIFAACFGSGYSSGSGNYSSIDWDLRGTWRSLNSYGEITFDYNTIYIHNPVQSLYDITPYTGLNAYTEDTTSGNKQKNGTLCIEDPSKLESVVPVAFRLWMSAGNYDYDRLTLYDSSYIGESFERTDDY